MLVGLFALLFLGGGGDDGFLDFGAVEKQLKSVMADSNERKAALNTTNQAKKDHKAHAKRIKDIRGDMRDVLQDPGVDLERISMLWDEYSKETRQWHKKLVDARFQLKDDLSREDWAKVFPAQ